MPANSSLKNAGHAQLGSEALAVTLIYRFVPCSRNPGTSTARYGACVSLGRDLAAHLSINNQAGRLTNFGDGVATQLKPALEVWSRSQGGRLALVAGRVRKHEVVREVARALGEGHKVVDVASSQCASTVEAT